MASVKTVPSGEVVGKQTKSDNKSKGKKTMHRLEIVPAENGYIIETYYRNSNDEDWCMGENKKNVAITKEDVIKHVTKLLE